MFTSNGPDSMTSGSDIPEGHCSNVWDDVTAALQLLSHLDGDALNVAFLVPESRRVVPGFLIKSLSDHYNSPGRLAEYKRQFQWAFRRPGDDPSIFAI